MTFKGGHHTEEAKRKISEASLGRKHTEEAKRKMSLLKMGNKNPMNNLETRKKMIETKKRQYRMGEIIHPMLNKHHSKKSREKMSESRRGKKFTKEHKKNISLAHIGNPKTKGSFTKGSFPNKSEKLLIKIIKQNKLPFNYVGNHKIWFKEGKDRFNPDFLSKNPKHIIELFGNSHNSSFMQKKDKKRLRVYSKYGYKTLIIWNNELKNKNQILNKIKDFIGG